MPTKVTVKDFENFSFSKSLETILEIVSPDKDQQDSKLHWNMESVEGLDPRLNCVCNPIELAIVLDLVAKSSKNSTILETYFTKFKRSFSTWKASGTNRTSLLPKETSFFWNIGDKVCSKDFPPTLEMFVESVKLEQVVSLV